MEACPRRYIEDRLLAAPTQLINKELPFALRPRFPINEFIPLFNEALDVLLLVVLRVAIFDWIARVLLLSRAARERSWIKMVVNRVIVLLRQRFPTESWVSGFLSQHGPGLGTKSSPARADACCSN